MPVTFAPGRAKMDTSPAATGSLIIVTIGMPCVAAWRSRVIGVVAVKIKLRLTYGDRVVLAFGSGPRPIRAFYEIKTRQFVEKCILIGGGFRIPPPIRPGYGDCDPPQSCGLLRMQKEPESLLPRRALLRTKCSPRI